MHLPHEWLRIGVKRGSCQVQDRRHEYMTVSAAALGHEEHSCCRDWPYTLKWGLSGLPTLLGLMRFDWGRSVTVTYNLS